MLVNCGKCGREWSAVAVNEDCPFCMRRIPTPEQRVLIGRLTADVQCARQALMVVDTQELRTALEFIDIGAAAAPQVKVRPSTSTTAVLEILSAVRTTTAKTVFAPRDTIEALLLTIQSIKPLWRCCAGERGVLADIKTYLRRSECPEGVLVPTATLRDALTIIGAQ